METSVHVPTRSLAVVCAAASSLGRINPKISADVVITGKMKRFMMVLFLMVGGCSLAARIGARITTGEAYHNSSWASSSTVQLVRRLPRRGQGTRAHSDIGRADALYWPGP